MTIYSVTHEWKDPDTHEYQQWHDETLAYFTTRELAEEYAKPLIAKMNPRPMIWDIREEAYHVREVFVYDTLPT